MHQPAAQRAGEAVEGQDGAAARPGGGLIGTFFRMAFFWWVMQYMKGGGRQDPNEPVMLNLFQRGESVDVAIYFNESPNVLFDMVQETEPVWEVTGVELALAESISKNVTFKLPPDAQRNGSVYIHAVVTREGYEFQQHNAFFASKLMTHYGPKRKEKKEKNLLFDDVTEADGEEEVEEEGPVEIVNYWKPRISVAMVDDFSKYTKRKVPVHLQPLFVMDPDADYYYPMIFFNEFWLLKRHMIELNETVDEVTAELTLSSIKPWLVQIITQMEESLKLQATMGLNSDEETDEFKKILVEGNPILLAVTFVVSMLHSVFDFLAFKNDIGFWRNNRSMEGLSARSILINAGCQLVVFLYLMDNQTSFVVLASAGIGVLIEFWKVTKAMKVTVEWRRGIPVPQFEDRASYSNSETKKHDAMAMKYLSYVLYPLVIGYSIYALLRETHRSWYSWILSSLVGAVYAFGFILMCPQLYLNYKLKSVAHLPWRQLTYKFLNTIIDDLFAFVITMPWMHRLSVFRDDLVFVIYLYQWYIYGVDRTRVNEFGFAEDAPPPTEENATGEGDATGESLEEESAAPADDAPETSGLRRRREASGGEEAVDRGVDDSGDVDDDDESKKDK